jgi:folate-binding protein YgfZ
VYQSYANAQRFEETMLVGRRRLDDHAATLLRVERGIPEFLVDTSEETIPLEAGLDDTISHTKGCYVGQEIIIRVLHRGHGRVARKLVGLTIDGDHAPAPGAAISSGDKEIGRVTSAAMSLRLKRPIALGYVQRDFVEPGTHVTIGEQAAAVTALPFVPREAFRPA